MKSTGKALLHLYDLKIQNINKKAERDQHSKSINQNQEDIIHDINMLKKYSQIRFKKPLFKKFEKLQGDCTSTTFLNSSKHHLNFQQ